MKKQSRIIEGIRHVLLIGFYTSVEILIKTRTVFYGNFLFGDATSLLFCLSTKILHREEEKLPAVRIFVLRSVGV